jgi:POT family proton-dependent oligopeptide transporter
LFGAYLADTHWGRYKTICVSIAVALLGHVLIIIAAIPGIINKPDACLSVFIVGRIIMGLGTGGFKANVSPLVAEQYTKTKLFISTTKSGERVIVDPIMTIARVYMVSRSSVDTARFCTDFPVFLSFHQHWCVSWANLDGIRRESEVV